MYVVCSFFFFKQKTAYEMRISDWSSDVCSSDLVVIVILCEVGQITPPAGFVLFILKGVAGKDTTMGELARGSMPYIILLLMVLALITVYPQLATYLPSAMLTMLKASGRISV